MVDETKEDVTMSGVKKARAVARTIFWNIPLWTLLTLVTMTIYHNALT